jgi:signal recognition particle receptor subunit beta
MSLLDPREKTINMKVVYYGPGLGGKTTSLKCIHRILDPHNRIKMVSLDTDDDRTLFFDFLPLDLGLVGKYRIRIQGFTVPGQVKYNMTRRYVLTGADGVVFVADSDPDRIQENVESLINLGDNLKSHGLDVNTIPLVLQYNKRDLPSALPVSTMEEKLNFRGLEAFETVATDGKRVFEAFLSISRQVIRSVMEIYNLRSPQESEESILNAAEERIRALAAGAIVEPPPHAPAIAVEPPSSSVPRTRAALDLDLDPLPALSPQRLETSDFAPETQPATEAPAPRRAPFRATPRPQTNAEPVVIPEERLTRRQRRGVLSSFLEIGRALLHETDAERSLLVIAHTGLNYLEARGGSFLALHPYRAILEPKIVLGFHADPLLALAQRAGERALLERIGLLGDGVAINAQSNADLLQEVRAVDASIGSILLAPVVARQATLGFLAFYFDQDAPRREREDVKFLMSLAMFSSLALDRAGESASRSLFNIQDVLAGRKR